MDSAVRRGRPPLHDYEARRAEIEAKLASGSTLGTLARDYGLTRPGCLKMLRRLGLQTHVQQVKALAIAALVASYE